MPSRKSHLQLYADECFPITSVVYLKSKGISIVHAFDRNYIQKPDKSHLELSKKLGRVLITLDRDFNSYKDLSLQGYPGVIVISVGSATPPNINRVCDKILKKVTMNSAKDSYIQVTNAKIIKKKW